MDRAITKPPCPSTGGKRERVDAGFHLLVDYKHIISNNKKGIRIDKISWSWTKVKEKNLILLWWGGAIEKY